MGTFGIFSREKKETLDKGLEKTKESVFKKLSRAVVGKSKVDDEVLDELEPVEQEVVTYRPRQALGYLPLLLALLLSFALALRHLLRAGSWRNSTTLQRAQ